MMDAIIGWIGAKLLSVVLPSLATIAATFAVSLVKRAAAKAGLDLSRAQEDAIRRKVQDAILQLEEAKRRDTKAGKPVISSEAALGDVTARLARALPDLPMDEITARIHAELPAVRAMLHGINSGLPCGGRR